VTLPKQEKVPALVDTKVRFATIAGDCFCIETKSCGQGDVHLLLHRHPDSPLTAGAQTTGTSFSFKTPTRWSFTRYLRL
jgi:hypothetical protein